MYWRAHRFTLDLDNICVSDETIVSDRNRWNAMTCWLFGYYQIVRRLRNAIPINLFIFTFSDFLAFPRVRLIGHCWIDAEQNLFSIIYTQRQWHAKFSREPIYIYIVIQWFADYRKNILLVPSSLFRLLYNKLFFGTYLSNNALRTVWQWYRVKIILIEISSVIIICQVWR